MKKIGMSSNDGPIYVLFRLEARKGNFIKTIKASQVDHIDFYYLTEDEREEQIVGSVFLFGGAEQKTLTITYFPNLDEIKVTLLGSDRTWTFQVEKQPKVEYKIEKGVRYRRIDGGSWQVDRDPISPVTTPPAPSRESTRGNPPVLEQTRANPPRPPSPPVRSRKKEGNTFINLMKLAIMYLIGCFVSALAVLAVIYVFTEVPQGENPVEYLIQDIQNVIIVEGEY